MMLNMDLIESSSESDDAETLDSLSNFDEPESDDENASSSSEVIENDSGQCSDIGEDDQDEEYDRIFNRGLSSNSSVNETGWYI
jgi:hypothetical protein